MRNILEFSSTVSVHTFVYSLPIAALRRYAYKDIVRIWPKAEIKKENLQEYFKLNNVKRLFMFTCLIFSCAVSAKDKIKVTEKNCKDVEVNIEATNNKLRAGYSSTQGEKLKARLQVLRELKRSCLQKKIPIK